jgi:hypothetical protein
MDCPFCKEAIKDGSIKCRHCHEFIVSMNKESKDKPAGASYTGLQFIADMMKSVAWPLIVAVILLSFHSDISEMFKRAKKLEVAGAKSEFSDYAAVFGYVQGKVGQMASEPNPKTRQQLKVQISETSAMLQGLHPLALAFLADIGRGVTRDEAWAEYPAYVYEIQNRGFISLSPKASAAKSITKTTTAQLTPLGSEFLRSIGYTKPKKR